MRVLFTSFVVMAFICLSVATAIGAVDKSLVLYITFDEGEGGNVADLSSYSNDGAIVGDPKWVDGQFGTALEFDGTGDSIEIPHNDSLNMSTGVTAEMWVKILPGGDIKQSGIEKSGWEVGGYSFYPVYESGTLAQFFDLPEGCDDECIGSSINDGNWHHFAGAWDGKEIFLYVDGELDKASKCEGKLEANSGTLYIGSRKSGERFLTGVLDEMRMYNRALTQAEIKTDMQTLGGLSVSPLDKLTASWGKVKQAD